jgi:hypothetical protein
MNESGIQRCTKVSKAVRIYNVLFKVLRNRIRAASQPRCPKELANHLSYFKWSITFGHTRLLLYETSFQSAAHHATKSFSNKHPFSPGQVFFAKRFFHSSTQCTQTQAPTLFRERSGYCSSLHSARGALRNFRGLCDTQVLSVASLHLSAIDYASQAPRGCPEWHS